MIAINQFELAATFLHHGSGLCQIRRAIPASGTTTVAVSSRISVASVCCATTLVDEQVEFFTELCDEDGDFSGARVEITNAHDLKTPLNLVIADAGNGVIKCQPTTRLISNKFCERSA